MRQEFVDAAETLSVLFKKFGCKSRALNVRVSKKYNSFHGRAGVTTIVLNIPAGYEQGKAFVFKEYERLSDMGIEGTMRDCLDALCCHEYAHVICQNKGLAVKKPHGPEFRAVYQMCRDEIGLDKRETVKPLVVKNELAEKLKATLFGNGGLE